MDPGLSVVLFRRTGWGPTEYKAWSEKLLSDGLGFIVTTAWAGEMVLRICVVNTLTTVDDIDLIIEALL